jgi:hypothetical protein
MGFSRHFSLVNFSNKSKVCFLLLLFSCISRHFQKGCRVSCNKGTPSHVDRRLLMALISHCAISRCSRCFAGNGTCLTAVFALRKSRVFYIQRKGMFHVPLGIMGPETRVRVRVCAFCSHWRQQHLAPIARESAIVRIAAHRVHSQLSSGRRCVHGVERGRSETTRIVNIIGVGGRSRRAGFGWCGGGGGFIILAAALYCVARTTWRRG